MAVHTLSELGESADRKLDKLADTSREALEKIKKKSIEDLYRDTTGWVQNNPGKLLLGAVASGVLVGWLLGRRR